MQRAFTASQIYDAEAPFLSAGVPLMARAARAIADAVIGLAGRGEQVSVFAGKGNNGADGLYAAAHLARAGHAVRVVTAFGPVASGAITDALAEAIAAGARVVAADEAVQAPVWVDALSGIGLRPPARGELGKLLRFLRKEGQRPEPPLVVAVDLPSGLGADSGAAPGAVVPADHTVTFGGFKAAQFLPPAAYRCGEVHLVDIGIGAELAPRAPEVLRLQARDIARWWPRPGPEDHKYTRGVVAVATGSRDYPGAAVLSVAGALGAGPGMVRYAGEVPNAVLAAHPEAITQAGRSQAWVVGSGISGRDSSAEPGVTEAIAAAMEANVPLILDAGGLDWVEGDTLADRPVAPTVVLTPHAGELAQLLTRLGVEVSREDVEADPARWARAGAEMTGASIVLKGGITLVASQGTLFSQADGSPWLATAGSGDVLAGVLGTVLAGWQVARERGTGPTTWPTIGHAIAAGVALHGLAGVRASGGGPTTASAVAAAVSPTLAHLLAD